MNSRIQTFVFMGILTGFGILGVFLPEKRFSPEENRYLAGKPEFTFESLASGKFGADYDKYLSDQFPGRNGWVKIQAGAEALLGKKDINGVYLGKDGYYIEKFDTEDMETELLSENLKAVNSFMLKASEDLGKDHVRLMLVPSASEILSDKLPLGASPYKQNQVTKGVESQLLVPVSEALKEHSQEEIYYRTDHHWTSLGAYYGYAAWAESLGIEPWNQTDFEISTVTDEFLGTIASKVNLSGKHAEEIKVYLPREETEYEVFYDGGSEGHKELYSWDYLEKRDKYSVFLDGNHGLTEIENRRLSNGKKLLLIKDSFAHTMAPFLANHFETVYMVDLRYFNMPISRFVEEKQITDVLVMYQIPGFAKENTVRNIGR